MSLGTQTLHNENAVNTGVVSTEGLMKAVPPTVK